MAVADTTSPSSLPPTPEECSHPGPVEGVMAHEFSHYDGANGPEGKRRTTTHYGPVIGGLPIAAWHCQDCGLLRMRYPDGRREERQLFPGPQPGLLAVPSGTDPLAEFDGRQATVSGLSVSRDLLPVLRAAPRAPLPPRGIPQLNVVDWFSILGLLVTAGGMLVAAVLAIAGYTTSPWESDAVWTTLIAFAFVLVIQIKAATWRHFADQGTHSPSLAESMRTTTRLDAVTLTIAWLLAGAALAELAAGIGAVYGYATATWEWPVVLLGLFCFGFALIIAIGRATFDHFAHPDDE